MRGDSVELFTVGLVDMSNIYLNSNVVDIYVITVVK